MFRIGLLECDHVGRRFASIAGDYGDMFTALLTGADVDVDVVRCDVWNGDLPSSPSECDAWMCTGSRLSVYDDEPWIRRLTNFVQEARGDGAPFAGICFGHQLLAHGLGGCTRQAATGWGAGAHRVEILRPEPWMDPPLAAPNLLFMHQDQVVQLPDEGVLLGRADHCPIAMLRVGDHMVGLQAHPEFPAAYADALYEVRAELLGEQLAAAARASLSAPTDEATVARWLVTFLRAANSGTESVS